MRYTVDYALAPHSRNLTKPNEDQILADMDNGIFIVLDGVTRVHDEYVREPFRSAACEVNELFLQAAYGYLRENIATEDKEALLKQAVALGNGSVSAYREQKSAEEWGFYPSTLGILAILHENTLHYVCAGDCLGVLLRKNAKILFGRQLTLEAVDQHNVTKQVRYALYCNHPENPLSYTVFNGDATAETGIEYAYLDLHAGDTVLLASDGIGCYVRYESNAVLTQQTTREMLRDSVKYDRPPYAEYGDDKAILKLSL